MVVFAILIYIRVCFVNSSEFLPITHQLINQFPCFITEMFAMLRVCRSFGTWASGSGGLVITPHVHVIDIESIVLYCIVLYCSVV